jgi:hypothetical protein
MERDIELSLIMDMWVLVLELEGMRTRILPAERDIDGVQGAGDERG